MKIVSDRIMSLSSPTWSARKARVLISDDDRVAVFTTLSSPARTFRVTSRTPHSMTTDDGEVIRSRPVGSSCSWPLAKCRVTTSQLEARWT